MFGILIGMLLSTVTASVGLAVSSLFTLGRRARLQNTPEEPAPDALAD